MKKSVSLLLTVVMLATMLVTVAVPASADNEMNLPYLEKTFTGSSFVTETKMLTSFTPVTAETTKLEAATPGAWFVVNNDVTFSERIEVAGDVNLLLLNGKKLTANKGITLESGNSLTVYAQSDDPAVMGQIIANSNTGDAGIGGRAGKNGDTWAIASGESGKSAGTFCQKGGKVSVTTETGTCIGGGNGGNGAVALGPDDSAMGGFAGEGGDTFFYGGITMLTGKTGIGGGNGGNGGETCYNTASGGVGGSAKNFTIYAGDITINSEDGVCIGSGNGGDAGKQQKEYGASGGSSLYGGNISFIGGTVKARSKTFFCFGGGKGGKAKMGGLYWGFDGQRGPSAKITLGVSMTAYNMNDDGTMGSRVESDNISETLNNTDKVIINAQENPFPDYDHTPVLQEGIAPTYDTPGFRSYYKCADVLCGKFFEDEGCTIEITDIDAWKAEGGKGYLAPLQKPEYIILSGANSKWTKGSKDGIIISCSGPIDELAGVYIDGNLVDKVNYNKYSAEADLSKDEVIFTPLTIGLFAPITMAFDEGVKDGDITDFQYGTYKPVPTLALVDLPITQEKFNISETDNELLPVSQYKGIEDGSAVIIQHGDAYPGFDKTTPVRFAMAESITPAFTGIELKPEYLETLSAGNHNLKFVYNNGIEVLTNFEIEKQAVTPIPPKTGDASNVALWIMLLMLSLIGITLFVVFGKKRKIK